jgi:hypothetical protein
MLNVIQGFNKEIKSRKMWWAGHVNVYRVLVGKPEGKTPLGRQMRRWKVGIRMDLRETGWGCRVALVGSG